MSSPSIDSDAAVPRTLAHCLSTDDSPASAYARLEEELGDTMARMLVSALANPHGIRGSSSP